ncbi:MAG TPA: metallophosphoesterase family protein [Anaerolineae bacterium]|nr:metallophosphoesterase family protein [Anaerolineae bacterium]
MLTTYARLFFALCFILTLLALILFSPHPAQMSSDPLLWKPYLQQLSDTSVVVQWVTQTGANPEVHYSTNASFDTVASGDTRTADFGASLHRVELTGLRPSITYTYKIYLDGADLLPLETFSFKTGPSLGSDAPFTFTVFGDYGTNTDSQKALRDQLLLDSFDFIVTTGDNASPAGNYPEFGTNVFDIYRDLFPTVSLFPALGNHDTQTENGQPYLDIFDLPPNAWRTSDRERYYSFNYGNVHFAVLDSTVSLDETDSAATDDMFDWLRDDLGQTPQPWQIVVLHHPAYSTGLHGSSAQVQAKLVPIFEAYGVDLVFSGHDHLYQRTLPIREDLVTTTAAGGIVYIVSGGGSVLSYNCSPAAWLAFSLCGQDYGLYNRVKVDGDTITLEAVIADGSVVDTLTLTQTSSLPLTTVSITGPTQTTGSIPTTLQASTQPVTTTPPITYTWSASDHVPQTLVSGLTSQVTFAWTQTGTQQVTVTALNAWGAVTDTMSVEVLPAKTVFVPVLLKPASD